MRGASRSRLLEEGELGLAQRGGATRLRRSLNLIFFVAVCAIAALTGRLYFKPVR